VRPSAGLTGHRAGRSVAGFHRQHARRCALHAAIDLPHPDALLVFTEQPGTP
jgi:hypothetical protein